MVWVERGVCVIWAGSLVPAAEEAGSRRKCALLNLA
jgi:hypothetical protein